MVRKALLTLAMLVALPLAAPAETIHLVTGETIRGTIVEVTENSIAVESEQGFGTIRIDKAEIALIEYDNATRDLSHKLGIGYVHRTAPQAVGAAGAEYGTDALSLKLWLGAEDWADLLLGFYSASDGSTKQLEVFTLDLRYGSVFERRASLDLYWGGSAGYINVTDNTGGQDFSATGTSLRAFVGAEVFPASLPGLGISAEIGAGIQTVGDRRITSLSTTAFPTLSLRYYY